jgi:hydroxymethylglutaryl-CoA reductase
VGPSLLLVLVRNSRAPLTAAAAAAAEEEGASSEVTERENRSAIVLLCLFDVRENRCRVKLSRPFRGERFADANSSVTRGQRKTTKTKNSAFSMHFYVHLLDLYT